MRQRNRSSNRTGDNIASTTESYVGLVRYLGCGKRTGACGKGDSQLNNASAASRILTKIDLAGGKMDKVLQKFRLFEVSSDDHISHCGRMRMPQLPFVRNSSPLARMPAVVVVSLQGLNLSSTVLLIRGTAYRDRSTETIKFPR